MHRRRGAYHVAIRQRRLRPVEQRHVLSVLRHRERPGDAPVVGKHSAVEARVVVDEVVEQVGDCSARREFPAYGLLADGLAVRAEQVDFHFHTPRLEGTRLVSPVGRVAAGIRRAVEAAKSGVERRKRGENTSQPHFSADSAVYDKRSATFHRDHVSLSTVDERVECDYILPDDSETPPTKYVSDEDFEFRMAHLQYRDGDWYLHASMRKVEADEEPSESESKHSTVLGVDLGVNNIAVASIGRFWSADEFNHWRREYEKRRGSLQQCGSRHAHENIESVGQKEYGRFEIHLHTMANELIEEAVENDCSHIVFEDLTYIRENIPEATWQHVWAFRRLHEYVEYKAEEHGVEAVQVDP